MRILGQRPETPYSGLHRRRAEEKRERRRERNLRLHGSYRGFPDFKMLRLKKR